MRLVAGLALVAVLLAVYTLVLDRDRAGSAEKSAEHPPLVAAFDRGAVRRITITLAGSPPFSLERQPSGSDPSWRLGAAGKAADVSAVEDLLAAIDAAEVERTADVIIAAAGGLTPPGVVVQIESRGVPVTLRFGRADATGRGVLVRAGDDPAVRVVSRRLFDLAGGGAAAFRDRKLVALPIETLTSIAWRGPGAGAPRRLRSVGGRWQNERHAWVAEARVREGLRRLADLRVDRYVGAPLEAFAIPASLELEAGAEARVSLRTAGAGCPSASDTLIARDDASGREGACLPQEALPALRAALEAAREPDTRLVSSPPEAVTRIEMAEGRRRLVLARAPSGPWRFESPKLPYGADARVVEDWLTAAGQTRVPPALPNSRGRRLSVDSSYPETAQVSTRDHAYALLDPDPLRFRDRAVLDFAHFDARSLRRVSADPSVELTSEDGETWRAAAPSGAPVDRTSAALVVGALAGLRAERFVSTRPSHSPELTLELVVAGPGQSSRTRHRLELYGAPARGCTGRLDGAAIFTLSRAACQALRLPLLARGG